MKASGEISGFSLFELVLAVAVLSILVSIVIGVGNYALKQAKTELAESTIGVLVTALEQYYDFTDVFPPECDAPAGLEAALEGTSPVTNLPEFSSSEALYYYLHRVPESRKIISAIDESQITGLDENGDKLVFNPDSGDEIGNCDSILSSLDVSERGQLAANQMELLSIKLGL